MRKRNWRSSSISCTLATTTTNIAEEEEEDEAKAINSSSKANGRAAPEVKNWSSPLNPKNVHVQLKQHQQRNDVGVKKDDNGVKNGERRGSAMRRRTTTHSFSSFTTLPMGRAAKLKSRRCLKTTAALLVLLSILLFTRWFSRTSSHSRLLEPFHLCRPLLCTFPLLNAVDLRLQGRLLNCRQLTREQQRLTPGKWPQLGVGGWKAAKTPLDMLITEERHQPAALRLLGGEDGLIIRQSAIDEENKQQKELRQWRETEALAALGAAKRSRSEGNLRKAKSIIEHAYSLAPYNPDILTEYGVYCEIVQRDVVEAEGFYLKALTRDPGHAEALIRRQRALPLVEEIDNRMMREIHLKRDSFMRIPRTDPGLRRAMRESYFHHVYHTVAIEGNTINLAQTRSILETHMAVAGKSIVEHNEILGLDAALRWLNQSLSEVQEITLEHILALHKRVLGYADPMTAGQLRTVQVFVGNFRPPDANMVPTEMDELVEWLNDEDTLSLDPVEAAALAHYKLVFIHPFTDGNGRTGRLLMNWILLRAGFPPVIIPVERRHRYYQVLREANDGDLRPFIRFIAELTERTLDSFISSAISSTTEGGGGGNGMCEIGGECPGRTGVDQTADSSFSSQDQGLPQPPFCSP